jgi:hypothetical protein
MYVDFVITLDRTSRLAASLLGVMIFIFVLFVHVPAVLGRPNEPDQVTYLTQAFTFSGIAFLATAVVRQGQWPPPPFVDRVFAIGRWQVAIGFLVLGIRQFFQMPFVHRLVPDWYPAQIVWALLAGTLLAATGVGIIFKKERVPAVLLSALLWIFLLLYHVPWLVIDPRNRDWGAACKDSILCAGALLVAATVGRRGSHLDVT